MAEQDIDIDRLIEQYGLQVGLELANILRAAKSRMITNRQSAVMTGVVVQQDKGEGGQHGQDTTKG